MPSLDSSSVLHEHRADQRGDDAGRRDGERVDDQRGAACSADRRGHRAQSHRGEDRADVGLEEVGAHAGHVADVVTDVVRDGGRVAGVVLGDARLDLADQVGADVRRLGVDAAADAREQRDRAEAPNEKPSTLIRPTSAEADDASGP
jgi:hypothetical protein